MDFGSRMHELLEVHFSILGGLSHPVYQSSSDEAVELEAQAMLAAYCSAYPLEPFDVLTVERVFKIPLNGSGHVYSGKFDGIIRYKDTKKLAILEHKTQKRGGQNNTPEAWAARAQVSLYQYAAGVLYQEPVEHILLDVLTRQSPKGQEPCGFYRDVLERTSEQVEDAIADLRYIADRIEAMEREFYLSGFRWPRNTDKCMDGRWECDYYSLHVNQMDEQLVQLKYKEADEYLPGL